MSKPTPSKALPSLPRHGLMFHARSFMAEFRRLWLLAHTIAMCSQPGSHPKGPIPPASRQLPLSPGLTQSMKSSAVSQGFWTGGCRSPMAGVSESFGLADRILSWRRTSSKLQRRCSATCLTANSSHIFRVASLSMVRTIS
jgi:hypothetical protein